MDGMEIEGRNIKVNETKSDGYRPKDRGPYDRDRERERDRDRDRDRSRQPQSDSYHPPPDVAGRKFRISINNLPEHFTWRELKDFLRTGAHSVSYANVSRPGFGCVFDFHRWPSSIIRLITELHPLCDQTYFQPFFGLEWTGIILALSLAWHSSRTRDSA